VLGLELGLDRVKVRIDVRVKVSGSTFKYVFGQTSIWASVLNSCFSVQKAFKCVSDM